MQTKKVALIITGILMIGTVFTGCATSDSTQAAADTVQVAEEDPENEVEDTADDTDAEDQETDSDSSQSDWENFLSSMFMERASIEETVLVDQDGIKITAKDIDYDDYSPELNLLIENNTDKELSFISGSIGYCCNSVSGYMFSSIYINEDVSPGKSCNTSVYIDMDELAMCGITEIADIELGFCIEDDDYNEVLVTGPIEIPTSCKDSYDYETDTYKQIMDKGYLENAYDADVVYMAEDMLYEKDDIRLLNEAFLYNEDGEAALLLEYENTSDRIVNVCSSDISVNGIVLQSGTWSSETINPGKRLVTYLDISAMVESGSLDALGITDINEVAFDLEIKDMDYNSVYSPETITVTIAEAGSSASISGEEVYNEDGIRVLSQGKIIDDFGDDVHLLFLVENNTDRTIYVSDDYDSLSVNDYMVDYVMYNQEIPVGKNALVDVEIFGGSLEENDMNGIDDIQSAEITFDVRDEDYRDIATVNIAAEY